MKRLGCRLAIIIAGAGWVFSDMPAAASALQSSSRRTATESYRTVTDDLGREVRMPAEVNRIVTLAPNLTEIVYALGLQDKLAGDTNECDTPPGAKSKPHVGEPQDPSLEAILALHPDLVLATTAANLVETADAIQHLGIPVYTSNGDTQTVLQILDSIQKMAELMGAKTRGDELVGELRHRLRALHARLENRPMAHVLFVVWLDPLITIGQNTFIADALRWAGAESVLISKKNWPQISIEEVVRLQPDYIVFAGGHTQSASTELDDLRGRSIWRDLDAVEAGRVVNLNQGAIRPSPGLVDAIEQLAHEVHPDAFLTSTENPSSKSQYPLAFAPENAISECNQCAR